jgi:hypothetical protein
VCGLGLNLEGWFVRDVRGDGDTALNPLHYILLGESTVITTKKQYLDVVSRANPFIINPQYLEYFERGVVWHKIIADTSYLNHLSNSNTQEYFLEQLEDVCFNVPHYTLDTAISIEKLNSSEVNPLTYMGEQASVNRINNHKELAAQTQATHSSKLIFLDMYNTALSCINRLQSIVHPGYLNPEVTLETAKEVLSRELFKNSKLFYAFQRETSCAVKVTFTPDYNNNIVFDVTQFGCPLYQIIYNLDERIFI